MRRSRHDLLLVGGTRPLFGLRTSRGTRVMISHRTIHSTAAIINGLALGAALLRWDRLAATCIAASMLLLIWSLEKFRVRLTRENDR